MSFNKGVDELFEKILTVYPNLIAISSALITLNGVFLTLLVTLKESVIFEKLKRNFPNLHSYMYNSLKKQLQECILLVFILIIVAIFFSKTFIFIKIIIIFSVMYLLIDISIGGIYIIKVVGNLTTKNIDSPTPPMK